MQAAYFSAFSDILAFILNICYVGLACTLTVLLSSPDID